MAETILRVCRRNRTPIRGPLDLLRLVAQLPTTKGKPGSDLHVPRLDIGHQFVLRLSFRDNTMHPVARVEAMYGAMEAVGGSIDTLRVLNGRERNGCRAR